MLDTAYLSAEDATTEEMLLDQEFDNLDLDVDFYAAHILPQGYIPQAGF